MPVFLNFVTNLLNLFEGTLRMHSVQIYDPDHHPFDEHDELVDDYFSSAGNVFWRRDMLQRKVSLVFDNLVSCDHPKKLEIRAGLLKGSHLHKWHPWRHFDFLFT